MPPGRAQNAIAYAFNREFAPVLKRQMGYFSKSSGGDKLAAVRGEVEQVKGVMVENIEKVLERGEHIDLLVDKSEQLDADAALFRKSSSRLRNQMWWQDKKFCIGLTLLCTIILIIIIASAVPEGTTTTTPAPL